MSSPLPNFSDETGEILLETGKKVVKNVVKTAVQSVKGQITGDNNKVNEVNKVNKNNKDDMLDPITGKPVIGKKLLTQLNQQVAQLAQMRIKKVREELEKQRLKVSGPSSAEATAGEEEKPKDDVIGRVLKASKSTGEFGKNIGG